MNGNQTTPPEAVKTESAQLPFGAPLEVYAFGQAETLGSLVPGDRVMITNWHDKDALLVLVSRISGEGGEGTPLGYAHLAWLNAHVREETLPRHNPLGPLTGAPTGSPGGPVDVPVSPASAEITFDAWLKVDIRAGVAGFIGDVHRALQVMNKPIPENVDYPEELKGYLGRVIREGTLDDLRRHPGEPMFVKPKEHKAFSGFLWTGDGVSRRRIVTHGDETPVFLCAPVTFEAEFRSFVLYGQVIDCRKYKGDWSKAPDKDTVLSAAKLMGKERHAYCLDWGVTSDGRTLLVEMNEGYSFGHYGLAPVSYARMLSARWTQMVK